MISSEIACIVTGPCTVGVQEVAESGKVRSSQRATVEQMHVDHLGFPQIAKKLDLL